MQRGIVQLGEQNRTKWGCSSEKPGWVYSYSIVYTFLIIFQHIDLEKFQRLTIAAGSRVRRNDKDRIITAYYILEPPTTSFIVNVTKDLARQMYNKRLSHE
jgi:hypothetical protein